jgi:hypothetical protein
MTIAGDVNTATLINALNDIDGSAVTLHAGNHSGATVDGALFLGTAGERSTASSLLSTDMGDSRLVQEALFPLRNRVLVEGSVMTIFRTDDSTSAWTASVGTGTVTLTEIDPL